MAAQVQFALAPVLMNDGIINYATPEVAKLYQARIKALPGSALNCEPHEIKVFLATLEDQAIRCGWMCILMILKEDPLEPDEDLINLLHNYGCLTLDQVQGHAETYINQEEWMAQDNGQLYHCIMNSLTKAAKAKVSYHFLHV